jgi:hypothetical protein
MYTAVARTTVFTGQTFWNTQQLPFQRKYSTGFLPQTDAGREAFDTAEGTELNEKAYQDISCQTSQEQYAVDQHENRFCSAAGSTSYSTSVPSLPYKPARMATTTQLDAKQNESDKKLLEDELQHSKELLRQSSEQNRHLINELEEQRKHMRLQYEQRVRQLEEELRVVREEGGCRAVKLHENTEEFSLCVYLVLFLLTIWFSSS